jgi:TPP-dependent pyruvate/acetoin dehydrogenase alpha subunit
LTPPNSGTATALRKENNKAAAAKLPREELTADDYREILNHLYLARYFDVRLIKEKKRGRLTGTLYSSHNQEGILVGSLYGLKPTDWISPIHRDMPAFFLKDARSGLRNPDRMGMSIQEVCAKVWGTIPVAAGVVYADRMDGGDAVCLTYNGEGSTAQGVFHEAINFAAVHKLPVITIIENNMWAYGTPAELEYALPDFARRADGYGIPGLIADGQDVFDVYDKVMTAVRHARDGRGPSIVECKTYRAYGHGDHDNDRADRYRDREEIEEGRSRDPIAVCKKYLLEKGVITEEEARRYAAEGKSASEATDEDFPPDVVAYLKEGIEFALKSPLPPEEEAAMWVFREDE